MSVKIITDSTSYINENLQKELDINIISLNISFDDEHFKETEISNDVFYSKMKKKGIPVSSQPSTAEIEQKIKSIISNGDSVLCVLLSSKMSGTFDSVSVIKKRILEGNPQARIEVIDSMSNSMQLGFAAIVGAKAANKGKNLQEVKTIVEANIRRSRFIFIPENLTYLKKGGRIGGASALVGNFLRLIPILTVEDGVTTILHKIRTKRRAIDVLIGKVINDVVEFGLGEIVVHHIDCLDEAKNVVEILKKKIIEAGFASNIEISLCNIGPVIGLHVGPGAIGIAYYTERDLR